METQEPFCRITGTATREVPRDLAVIHIQVIEEARTPEAAQEALKARVRGVQANIKSLDELDIHLSEHDLHEGLPQTRPNWRQVRDKEPVVDGYTCSWNAGLQTKEVDRASAIVEHLRKGQEDAQKLTVAGSFRLTEETSRRVARELFDAARDDAMGQLREQAKSLGFDPEKCRLVRYGDPDQDGGRRMARSASLDSLMGDLHVGSPNRPSEPLELHPGTQRVTSRITFELETRETIYLVNDS